MVEEYWSAYGERQCYGHLWEGTLVRIETVPTPGSTHYALRDRLEMCLIGALPAFQPGPWLFRNNKVYKSAGDTTRSSCVQMVLTMSV
jgi:hypothetical protein